MAGLAHGRASVTTLGRSSEPFWATSDATAAVAGTGTAVAGEVVRLLADDRSRAEMGRGAAQLYRERFAVEHTVAALQGRDS